MYVSVDEMTDDFMFMKMEDDFVNTVNRGIVKNLFLKAVREFGFGLSKETRQIILPVDQTLLTAQFPEDYVDFVRIGVQTTAGTIRWFNENPLIAAPMRYDSEPHSTDPDNPTPRSDAKTVSNDNLGQFPYWYGYPSFNSSSTFYGYATDGSAGQFKINKEQNRIELLTNVDEIILEYIYDAALTTNPQLPVLAEKAAHLYVYFNLVQKKSNIPMNEKMRARNEYFNERRLANIALGNITKEALLGVGRKNFHQSIKN
jgi:hypothetical protein